MPYEGERPEIRTAPKSSAISKFPFVMNVPQLTLRVESSDLRRGKVDSINGRDFCRPRGTTVDAVSCLLSSKLCANHTPSSPDSTADRHRSGWTPRQTPDAEPGSGPEPLFATSPAPPPEWHAAVPR